MYVPKESPDMNGAKEGFTGLDISQRAGTLIYTEFTDDANGFF
jgi:hypothetical protein